MIFGSKPASVHFIPVYPSLSELTIALASLVQTDFDAARNDEPSDVRLAIQGAIVTTARAIAVLGEPAAYKAPDDGWDQRRPGIL